MKSKKERQEKIGFEKVIEFKWSVSRGRDTYGWSVCRLYIDGQKTKYAVKGRGGYDMQGEAFSGWIKKMFPEELKKLDSSKFYGLSFRNEKTKKYQKRFSKNCRMFLDGACGLSCMWKIMYHIGYCMEYVKPNCYSLTVR
jgi:hypothetical protein